MNDTNDIINEKNEEIERGKLIIQEKEKNIKKIKEAHKKEVQEIQRERIAAQEDLNSLKKENNNIKDKENTLLEIFGMLKKFVKIDDNSTDNITTDPSVANITKTAECSTSPQTYSCKNCKLVASSMDVLNKHIREEHIVTKYPCLDCNFQALSMAVLRAHQDSHGARAKTFIKCDECVFTTSSENNLEVHKSKKHSQFVKCKLCEKEYNTESELLVHEELDHNKSKFICQECTRIFPSSKKLQDHMQYQHGVVSHYPCDYCGYKFENITDLDEHIAGTHMIVQNNKPNKDVDMRDLSDREPCNPSSPTHTSNCCDRKPRGTSKTPPKVCHFQEYCRYGSEYCRFFHYNKEEQKHSFFGRRRNQEYVQ